MNAITISPTTCNYKKFCKECGAELRLVLRRSRPALFAPPQQFTTLEQTSRSSSSPDLSREVTITVEMEDLFLPETMGVEAKCILDEYDGHTLDFVGMTESAEYVLISKNRYRE